jgi:hypothetical protein
MLGNTLGNLENELLFVRNSLGCLAIGDLLLVDAVQCFAPANQHEEIRQRDPWLSPQAKVAWQQRVTEFLSGPIRRYAPQAEDIELRANLGYGCCPVPGSYAVEIEVSFRLGSVARRFTIMRIKRQDAQQLDTCLQNLGWAAVDGWHYGEEPPACHPELLHLFRRGTSSA